MDAPTSPTTSTTRAAQVFIDEVKVQREKRLKDNSYPAEYWESELVYELRSAGAGTVRVTLLGSDGFELSASVPVSVIDEAREAAEAEAELIQAAGNVTERTYWALDLLGCYLVRAASENGVNGYHWAHHKIGNGLPRFEDVEASPRPRGQQQNGPDSVIIAHSKANAIEQRLRDGRSVLIDGRTGSGKSGQTALMAYRCGRDEKIQRIDLDLMDTDDGPESVLSALLTLPAPEAGWYLLVVENIHASLSTAKAVFGLVDALRAKGLRISVLANGWVELNATREKLKFLGRAMLVQTEPHRVVDGWAERAGVSPDRMDAFRRMTGDGQDITLASLALDYFKECGEIPTDAAFTEYTAKKFGLDGELTPELRACLYEFACLGSFDMEIPAWLRRKYVAHACPFGELIERWDTSYRIGSRSVAREVARYFHQHWKDDPDHPLPHPAKRASNQLDEIGDRLYRAQLDRLDLINLTRQGAGEVGQLVAKVWSTQRHMIDLLVHRAEQDPEWGDNAACAAFAAIALYRLGLTRAADECAQRVRDRWDYQASPMPRWRGDRPSAEAADFEHLKRRMKVEDEQRAAAGGDRQWREEMRAERIELPKLHRTWMLGVLLCLEGADPVFHDERVEMLYEAAEEAWRVDGCFYPERIPWMTARLLLGLCAVGKANSPLAEKAVEWLVNWHEPGGGRAMDWSSGTGDWNTKVMTNAMCLTALLKQGRPGRYDQRIRVAYSSMLAEMEKQTDVTRAPVDYGLIIEAILLQSSRGEDRAKAYDKLSELLAWISSRDTWAPRRTEQMAMQGTVESTELPFTAWQVAECVWNLATTELDKLYREFIDGPPDSVSETGPVPPEPGPIPGPTQSPEPAVSEEVAHKVRRAVTTIRATIQEDMAGRRNALRSVKRATKNRPGEHNPLGEHLERYAQYDRELDDLERLIELGPVTEALVHALDDLGVRVLGGAYDRCLPPPSG